MNAQILKNSSIATRIKKSKAFSLVELIIVIAIIGILAALAVQNLGGVTGQAGEAVTKNNVASLLSTLQATRALNQKAFVERASKDATNKAVPDSDWKPAIKATDIKTPIDADQVNGGYEYGDPLKAAFDSLGMKRVEDTANYIVRLDGKDLSVAGRLPSGSWYRLPLPSGQNDEGKQTLTDAKIKALGKKYVKLGGDNYQ